jgi:malonyl-CoA/methylmalonyl-CoA synthetase
VRGRLAAVTPLLHGLPYAAVTVDGRSLAGADWTGAVGAAALAAADHGRVALWCEPVLETPIAVAGALTAGTTVIPLNPAAGVGELEHELRDATPEAILAAPTAELPPPLSDLPRIDVDATARASLSEVDIDADATALIVYTSGTTGPPKGVVVSRRAIAANLDALVDAWAWTADDVVVQALPLFHVHGLVLGILGPLRLGGGILHTGRFSPEAVGAALDGPATMLFGVPTMYGRLLAAAEDDPRLADALRGARLLVSGSAALPARVHEAFTAATGQRIIERYGMSEAMMIASARHDGPRIPGAVGSALEGVEIRIVGDDDLPLDPGDEIGGVEIRSTALFEGYLGQPEATSAAFHDGWFRTGDIGSVDADGILRLVGRRSTDLIKTGGYRVGAGEIEAALLEHPEVAECAVRGVPDDDLGERIHAWVVPRVGSDPDPAALSDHVAGLLAPHKRPRAVHLMDALPRNALGKVVKTRLAEPDRID